MCDLNPPSHCNEPITIEGDNNTVLSQQTSKWESQLAISFSMYLNYELTSLKGKLMLLEADLLEFNQGIQFKIWCFRILVITTQKM